jgi:hypothetical protein
MLQLPPMRWHYKNAGLATSSPLTLGGGRFDQETIFVLRYILPDESSKSAAGMARA